MGRREPARVAPQLQCVHVSGPSVICVRWGSGRRVKLRTITGGSLKAYRALFFTVGCLSLVSRAVSLSLTLSALSLRGDRYFSPGAVNWGAGEASTHERRQECCLSPVANCIRLYGFTFI